MVYNIDEIYDLFIWDRKYSDEEYRKREQLGIEEASKLKNIYPFIMPVIVPTKKSKSVWASCAKVISLKTDSELQPFLHLLFEWLQDLNWPGAYIIFDRLLKMPYSMLQPAFEFSLTRAKRHDDDLWYSALEFFKEKIDKINPTDL